MSWWINRQLRASNPQTRLAVVEKLALESDANSIGSLLLALKDKVADVRCAAARAVVRFADRRAVAPLIELLRDTVPLVRIAAAESLGKLADPAAMDKLVPLLRDQDPIARAIAARSLHRLGWRPNTDTLKIQQILAIGNLHQLVTMGPEAVEPLLELMRYGSPNKQLAAVKTLGEINDPRLLRTMIEALHMDTPAIRIAALETLERLADPATYPEVEKLLNDVSASVRSAAVDAVTRCNGRRAVPRLLLSLKDPSWEVRRAAAKALGFIGEASAVPGLCELVKDPDLDVREAGIAAIGQIGDPQAIPSLVIALLDVERTARNLAQTTLKKIQPDWEQTEQARATLPAIKAALTHSDYWVRHSATVLLEQFKIDASSLVDELKSSPAEISPPPPHLALPFLADLLFDRDPELRVAAAEALGRLQEKHATAILAAAARDANQAVQLAAEKALAALN